MKNYKGFEKKPYCVAHYPKLTATAIADTPEMNRLRENTKLQSQVQYHAEYEKTKDQFTVVAETPEMALHKQNTALASNIGYDQRDHNAPADAGGYNPPPSMVSFLLPSFFFYFQFFRGVVLSLMFLFFLFPFSLPFRLGLTLIVLISLVISSTPLHFSFPPCEK